jgi:AcrR family transcriptional regulator
MPTGVALQDGRGRLLAAGERVLLRDGPAALTSRSVTDEADVAKGLLHRYFSDFDEFLTALVQTQTEAVEVISTDLLGRVGSGTVVGNVSMALSRIFDARGLALVRLALFRLDLATRLRSEDEPAIPILANAVAGMEEYLTGEQRAGRIKVDAAPFRLAQAVIGTGHLLSAGELGGLPDKSAIDEVVEAILVAALNGPY